ncbi:hypothetical protein A679_02089 [Salmonella enterica subsp. enterica serovar Enteritidis str. 2010K-0284]|nr:hypothetical protein A679_02089 [Salmonella enterica subsp. enterica serovar Enteritidis str. 2010K-0284]
MPVQDKLPIIVFPAPAGINCCRSVLLSSIISVPRASGDKPACDSLIFIAHECSPRQRG